MSSPGILSLLPEDRFQCSICLNVFSDPVTTPCGHNFCKACISEHWDNSDLCQCPKCNKRFHARPEVSTNTIMEEISTQIKKRRLDEPEGIAAAWEVTCDICTGIKFKAQKSCLGCLTSYCAAHLEPHQRVPSLMRHKLIEPVDNLEERMCQKHERLLELFCRDEQMCVCLLCCETDHRDHDTVPVEEEAARQKENIEHKQGEIQMLIEERREKIEKITKSSEMRTEKANKDIEDSNKLFAALMSHVQVVQTRLQSSIQEKLRSSTNKADMLVQELRQEITDLQKRYSELEQVLLTEDHLHLLQTLQALCSQPATKNWSEVRVYSDVCVGMMRRSLSDLVQAFQAELKTLTNLELERMRNFKESVTLDPNTANRWLTLSEENKRVKSVKTANVVPDNPERFETHPGVLGKNGFSSGRHYWEVQVGLRNDWDVGVAKETVTRKGKVTVNKDNGYFFLGKSGYDYEVCNSRYKTLHLNPRPRKIGVYVDYEEGHVSFYDVDQKSHIYSFEGESFTEKLFPYFYLHSKAKKSEPLVITFIGDYRAHWPVSLPCGHCFCLGCIGEYWRLQVTCQCPLCRAVFPTRPPLKTDKTLHAAAQTEQATVPLRAGEVPCDLCPAKHRAVKSCLVCLASYCDAHLEPHYQDSALGRHRLVSVWKNLEDAVYMASSSASSDVAVSVDQHLTCSICLDVFDEPVTTPCGHSFCKSCLNRNLVLNDLMCPLCKQHLRKAPEVNIVLRNIVQQLGKTQKKQDNEYTGAPGEVACDVCTGKKLKAEKSCLVCLASYCSTHLELHSTTKRLEGHKLVEPVKNLDDRACLTHGRPLELYCRKQQRCICALCVEKGQEVVTVEAEWTMKKDELDNIKTELQQKIKKREDKVDEISASLKACVEQLDSEWWDIDSVFTALIAIVEEFQARALQPLKDRRDVVEKEAKDLTEELQAEITKFRQTISELDDISALEDHICFLQTYPSLPGPDYGKDWTAVDLDTSLSFGTMRKITATMLEQIQQKLEKLTTVELERVIQFAVDVKLDPDTAHTHLILSDDGKEVKDGGEIQDVPDAPERFDLFGSVLGLNKLASGKSYWEVEVGEKTGWDLGVARGDANRKGKVPLNPSNGYWVAVHYDDSQYAAMTAPPIRLSLKDQPQRVGVFVDYDEGLVSFYDVKASSHIYSFTECVFTNELYPYFSPHLKQNDKNADPLIISAVSYR
ncbi:uncharacterized protein LOC115376214 [Myripristis murdjan]|uniref:uncharacterized protein LOC115376214 n=1 Tax=Myripristis murdjan TaxID=586833 RepID=UPI001175CBC8|nr:uncharacterized protein LOC115376214 [Myripristis murdjan]